jgi:hypothetical protein
LAVLILGGVMRSFAPTGSRDRAGETSAPAAIKGTLFSSAGSCFLVKLEEFDMRALLPEEFSARILEFRTRLAVGTAV